MATATPSKAKPKRPALSLRKLHFKDQPERKNRKLQMSFGGCGFLGVYHVGVGKCVVDHAPHLFTEFDAFYGASAGAITAVCAACRSDPMVAYKWVRKTFEDSKKYWFGMLNPSFDLYGKLRTFLEDFLPENAHRLCRDIVKISLTVFKDNGMPVNWLVSDFRTRSELINIIVASSFIPLYAGFRSIPKIRGKRCCDGGFTSNIPCLSDPDVITVTPFAGFCDICPQCESSILHTIKVCDQPMQVSPKNLYRLAKSLCPTSWKELEELYHQGYSDCLAFLRKEGLVPDPVIQKRRASSPTELTPSTSTITIPTTAKSSSFPESSRRRSFLTLSADGEFYNSGERESIASLPLEEVERGLDLRVTEKATNLMMKCGQRESLHEDMISLSEEEEREPSIVIRVLQQPVKLAKSTWNCFIWMIHSYYFRDILSPLRLQLSWQPYPQPEREARREYICDEESSSHDDGIFVNIVTSCPSSMLIF